MCRCKGVHSPCCLLRAWDTFLSSPVTDAVVAINGVWILLETYTLNSTILRSLWTQMLKQSIFHYRFVSFIFLQMDFLGSKLFPGVTLFFWQVSVLLAFSLSYKLSILSFACTQLWFLFFLLPSSLWCRSVVENFWPGPNGLFQFWLESVSNKLHCVKWSIVKHSCPTCTSYLLSRFDFSVTVFAFLGLIALAFNMEPFYFIVVLRPLQLLR